MEQAPKVEGTSSGTSELSAGLGVWFPIEPPPENSDMVLVGWISEDGEQYDFDYWENDCWMRHEDLVQYADCCAPPGSTMPPQTAPYAYWMRVPPLPKTPNAELTGAARHERKTKP